jgi:hypothetical protein
MVKMGNISPLTGTDGERYEKIAERPTANAIENFFSI